jgi:predicted flap endonuclease-1-like 5' DNA nuclease
MDATLEKYGIDQSIFAEDEQRLLAKGIQAGAYQDLAAMIQSVTPEKAAAIAKIQAQLRPREFTFVSKVQQEFEIWMKDHNADITPEIEAEWQKKIDAEREAALKSLAGDVPMQVTNTDKGTTVKASNALLEVGGLGEASIAKLNEAGIFSIDELKLVPHEKLVTILNPLVAAKVKTFFTPKA